MSNFLSLESHARRQKREKKPQVSTIMLNDANRIFLNDFLFNSVYKNFDMDTFTTSRIAFYEDLLLRTQ